MPSENRRSFVKKSVGTTITVSFAGLIRAHGEEGTTGTTWNPEETTVTTDSGVTTTWSPEESTYEITGGGGTTTWNPEETTSITTGGNETTTCNPDATTCEFTTVVTTTQQKWLFSATPTAKLIPDPAGPPPPRVRMIPQPDGYNEDEIAVTSTNYKVKIKTWCIPAGGSSDSKVTLTAMAEANGDGHTITSGKISFEGTKDSPYAQSGTITANTTPVRAPGDTSDPSGQVIEYYTGTKGELNYRFHRVVLAFLAERASEEEQTLANKEIVNCSALLTVEIQNKADGTWTSPSPSQIVRTQLTIALGPDPYDNGR